MQATVINTANETIAFAETPADYLPVELAYAYSHATNPTDSSLSFKMKRLAGHVLGTLVLAVALLAQPSAAAVMALAQAGGGAGTPASHRSPVSSVLPSTGAPSSSQYFAPTGKSVSGDFLNIYKKYGLSRIGYPVSDEVNEGGTRVQYFERVRMEFHPELSKAGYNVMLTRLGAQISEGSHFATVAPFASTASRAYVRETGHSLAEPFLSYWKKNGGVDLFGYAISEAIKQDGMTVQWFERARMEYHPELASKGQAVQLTLLGKLAYDRAGYAAQAQAPSGGAGVAAPQAPAAGSQAGVALTDKESYVLKAINDQRAAAGLAPVQINAGLTDLSRYRSNDMASRKYFSHVTPEGAKFLGMLSDRGVAYKFAGEILARNNFPSDQTAQIAMEGYLGSAPHKAILMDGRFTQVGVGHAVGGEEMSYFTVIFIQP
jgi:uncharacterized protein YkwD